MITVYLVRHGETAWNQTGLYCGRTDIPLSTKGEQQARQLIPYLNKVHFSGIYSSPLKRAIDTATLASGSTPTTDERLIEMDFGNWEGKTRTVYIAEDPECWNNWLQTPEIAAAGRTGENASQIAARAESFFNDLYQQYDNGNFLVVAHNNLNRFYLTKMLGMQYKNYQLLTQENAQMTIFTLDKINGFKLKVLNGFL